MNYLDQVLKYPYVRFSPLHNKNVVC
nr:hypothetical protein [Sicyoidochytrium minutum DNA virus]